MLITTQDEYRRLTVTLTNFVTTPTLFKKYVILLVVQYLGGETEEAAQHQVSRLSGEQCNQKFALSNHDQIGPAPDGLRETPAIYVLKTRNGLPKPLV
jgi:hypothetical protein